MFGLGTQELIIVFVIVMVLFGAARLPQIGRGLGEAIRNFKASTNPKEEKEEKKEKDEWANKGA